MKAISLWEPWATLIAMGVKTIETRHWRTSYRGPLAVHAAKRLPQQGPIGDYTVYGPARLPKGEPWMLWTAARDLRHTGLPLPLGAVVATCTLVDVVPMVEPETSELPGFGTACLILSPPESGLRISRPLSHSAHGFALEHCEDQRPYGDFSPGRYAWILSDIKPVDPPVAARGRQQLWDWDWTPPMTESEAP